MKETIKMIMMLDLQAKKHFYNNLNAKSKRELKQYCQKSGLLREFYNFLITL